MTLLLLLKPHYRDLGDVKLTGTADGDSKPKKRRKKVAQSAIKLAELPRSIGETVRQLLKPDGEELNPLIERLAEQERLYADIQHEAERLRLAEEEQERVEYQKKLGQYLELKAEIENRVRIEVERQAVSRERKKKTGIIAMLLEFIEGL